MRGRWGKFFSRTASLSQLICLGRSCACPKLPKVAYPQLPTPSCPTPVAHPLVAQPIDRKKLQEVDAQAVSRLKCEYTPTLAVQVSIGFYKRFVGVNSAVLSIKSKPTAKLGGTRKIDRLWLTNAVFVSTCTSKLLPDFVLMTLKNPNCKHTKHPKFVLKKRPYPTWQELRGEFMPRSARGVGRPCFG